MKKHIFRLSAISSLTLIISLFLSELAFLYIIPNWLVYPSIAVFLVSIVGIIYSSVVIKKMKKYEKGKMWDKVTKVNKKKLITSTLITFLIFILIFAANIFFYEYGRVDTEQIIYHMFVDNTGTDLGIIASIFIPAIIMGLVGSFGVFNFFYTILAFGVIRKNDIGSIYKAFKIAPIVAIISLIAFIFYAVPIVDFVKCSMQRTDFIESIYVNPDNVEIEFPENKRNLIYICLESMENTYTSVSNGGVQKNDLVPEITKLCEENINFSNTDKIGGALKTQAMTWTTASMVAEFYGIPLKVYGEYFVEKDKVMFPTLTGMFNIMEEQGYNTAVTMGSTVDFGGIQQLLNGEKNTAIYDLNYYIEQDMFKLKDTATWGLPDNLLYEYFKQTVTEYSQKDESFFLVMETVDTHAPIGYKCELCENKYDDVYSNTISCASKQLYNFIEWAKTQEWYENTTIVAIGDHLSMKNDFFASIDSDYERTTTNIIINPAETVEFDDSTLHNRKFYTADFFPTVLAAIGCKIDGDRLGVGTNLFSDKPTIFEEYGVKFVNQEFAKRNTFYEQLKQH